MKGLTNLVSSSNCISTFPASITLKHFPKQAAAAHSMAPAGTDTDRKERQMDNGFTDTWKQKVAIWPETEANKSRVGPFMVPENEEALVC